MVVARVIRPREGKLRVHIPYIDGSNETLIRSSLPSRAQVTKLEGTPVYWEVARDKLAHLVQGLIADPRIDDIRLDLYQSGNGGCVSACFLLGGTSDEAILNCQCSCIGFNHGSGLPPDGARHVGVSVRVGDVYRFPGGIRTVMYSQLRSEF